MHGRRSIALLAALAIAIALLIVWLSPTRRTSLVFLAVGQGDAALFQTEGRAVLIDAGPAGAGDRIVVPELRKRGVRKLDLVLISHPDADHVAGLPAVARKFPIVAIAIPAYFRDHPDMQRMLADAHISLTKVSWISGPSDARVAGFNLHMDVPPYPPGTADNEGSLMARISAGSASATFTGDAGFLEEFEMMKRGSWASQILKLGHHGSKFSSGDAWLDHVHPSIGIVSCGRGNEYGHPHPEVLDKCTKRGIEVLRTDLQGHLAFSLKDGKWVLDP